MNRGARRLPVFGDDDDRRYFLHLTGEALEGLDAEAHAYALMTNHYHLLVRGAVPAISAFMKSVGELYTRWFNDKYDLDGALFRGRFRSKPIDSERYQLAALRYIHRNPIDTSGAGWDYQWTSHRAYSGRRSAHPWLVVDELLSAVGGPKNYAAFVYGDGPSTEPASPSPPGVRVDTPQAVEWALGLASDEERALIAHGGRGIRNDQRAACALLCLEFTQWQSSDLAARYGYRSGNSFRTAATRARQREAHDAAFGAELARARSWLRPRMREAG